VATLWGTRLMGLAGRADAARHRMARHGEGPDCGPARFQNKRMNPALLMRKTSLARHRTPRRSTQRRYAPPG
jgi:hypothetical protein